MIIQTTGLAKETQDFDGDLLIENPNHTGAAWHPYHSDSEEEASDEEQDEQERSEAIEELSHMLNQIHAA